MRFPAGTSLVGEPGELLTAVSATVPAAVPSLVQSEPPATKNARRPAAAIDSTFAPISLTTTVPSAVPSLLQSLVVFESRSVLAKKIVPAALTRLLGDRRSSAPKSGKTAYVPAAVPSVVQRPILNVPFSAQNIQWPPASIKPLALRAPRFTAGAFGAAAVFPSTPLTRAKPGSPQTPSLAPTRARPPVPSVVQRPILNGPSSAQNIQWPPASIKPLALRAPRFTAGATPTA